MKFKFLFLLLVALSSISFFKPVVIDPLSSNFGLIFGMLTIASFFPVLFSFLGNVRFGKFTVPILLLLIALAVSSLNAKIYWDQGLKFTLFGVLFKGFGYFFYFYLFYANIQTQTIEKVIDILGLAFIAIFLTSFVIYPRLIVSYNEVIGQSVFQRIFVMGDGFLFLFYFFSINRYNITKKPIYLGYIIAAVLCILLNQTRVYILATLLITSIYILKSSKFVYKVMLVASFVIGLIFISDSAFYVTMQKRTENDVSKGDDYIRVSAAEYFLTSFQRSTATQIMGNGMPYGDQNTYVIKMKQINKYYKYFVEDIGFAGLYTYYGLLAILSYIIIFFKSFRAKILSNYTYAKMMMFFILLTSATTSATFNASFIIPIVFTIYLIEKGFDPLKRYNIGIQEVQIKQQ